MTPVTESSWSSSRDPGWEVRIVRTHIVLVGILFMTLVAGGCNRGGNTPDYPEPAPSATRLPSPVGQVVVSPFVVQDRGDGVLVAKRPSAEIFADNDDVIRPESKSVMEHLGEQIISADIRYVRVDSYADALNEPGRALELARRRADAFEAALLSMGEDLIVEACGRGYEDPGQEVFDPQAAQMVLTLSTNSLPQECP